METKKLIRNNAVQTKRLEKIIDAEHQLIQLGKSKEGVNFLFCGQEEQAQWWENYHRKIKKLNAEIESLQEKYITNFFIK